MAEGVSFCFDEWANGGDGANGGDHGVSINYNGETAWEERAPCGNREGCEPVSLFEDSSWHSVELKISLRMRDFGVVPREPSYALYMRMEFDFDDGLF